MFESKYPNLFYFFELNASAHICLFSSEASQYEIFAFFFSNINMFSEVFLKHIFKVGNSEKTYFEMSSRRPFSCSIGSIFTAL